MASPCDVHERATTGLISADTIVDAETSVFPEIEFVLLAVLLDENAKKPVVGEGMFNFTLVLACETISSRETAEDVSA